MTNPVWAGVTIDPELLKNYGWYTDTVVVSGTTYTRWIGYQQAGLVEMTTLLSQAGAALVATSSTNSVAIGTGTKTLTVVSPGTKGFTANMYVYAADASNSANSITGTVTSYSTTTGALVISVPTGGTTGSGTPTSWNIGISGKIGAEGPTFTGGTLSSGLNETAATLASASTVNIGAAAGNYLSITGTTTITAFDSVQAGAERVLRFAAALTLTHNATSLILPTGASITTAAGDIAVVRSEGSGNWRCVGYTRANGTPLAGSGVAVQQAGASVMTGATTFNFTGGAQVTNVGGIATVFVPTSVTARYWRLLATGVSWNTGSGNYYMDFVEVELYATGDASGTKLTVSTAAASSTFSGSYPATNAFDGNSGTDWVTANAASTPQWIYADLGAAASTRVAAVKIKAWGPSGSGHMYIASSLALQASNDASTWTTVSTLNVPDTTGSGSGVTFTFLDLQ